MFLPLIKIIVVHLLHKICRKHGVAQRFCNRFNNDEGPCTSNSCYYYSQGTHSLEAANSGNYSCIRGNRQCPVNHCDVEDPSSTGSYLHINDDGQVAPNIDCRYE